MKEHLKESVKIISGNSVAAWAARYARVQVISAYPITPQTTIVEKLSDFVDSEGWDCQYMRVESEHSVMAFLIGASFAGTRTFSATSGQGLFYMNEMLHWAAPSRLPIVLTVANRGVAPGWNIWADHQDVIASRDTGWLILFASSHQDIFDTIIQAYRIAEDPRVYLPIMVCLEGFQLSHTIEPVEIPGFETIRFIQFRFNALHDMYLGSLAEDGLIGTGMVFGIFFMIARIYIKKYRLRKQGDHFATFIIPLFAGVVVIYLVGGLCISNRFFSVMGTVLFSTAGIANGYQQVDAGQESLAPNLQ